MSSHVFTIDGMTFISGLFWYPLAGISQSDRAQEIKSLAKEQNFDLYILRSTSTYYVGFAHSDGQARIGVSSAAAVVSKTLEMESSARDFIFVSPLPDGHWMYVAQRDGVILPDADKCFQNEDAAKSRLLEDISLGDWSLIIAPDIWGVSGSIEKDFSLMLPETAKGKKQFHKWWKLSPVNPYDSVFLHGKKIIAGLAFLLIALGVWAYYQEKLNMSAIEEAQKLTNINQPPPPPPVHPWKLKPDPIEFTKNCTEALSTVPLFPGNWDLTGMRCAGPSLDISWAARTYGWIDHIKAIIPTISISGAGKVANLSIPLKTLTIGKDEPVMLGKQRTLQMYSLSQRYGLDLILTPAPPPPAPLPGQAATNVPQPDWAEVSWAVRGTDNPLLAVEILNGQGFRINSMDAVWKEGKIVWNLEGTQYVQP